MCSATFPIAVQRLINSCVESPITLRVNSVDMTHGGLSSDVTVVTRVVTSNTRFVRFLHSSHTKDALLDTLRSISEPPVLIFVNSIGDILSDGEYHGLRPADEKLCDFCQYPQGFPGILQ